MSSKFPTISFKGFYPELNERHSAIGKSAKWIVGGYLYGLPELIDSLRLSRNEFLLICDVMNGSLIIQDQQSGFDTYQLLLPHLWASIADAEQDGYEEKWNINLSALVNKVRGYSKIQQFALADLIVRFWGPSSASNHFDTEVRLNEIGFKGE